MAHVGNERSLHVVCSFCYVLRSFQFLALYFESVSQSFHLHEIVYCENQGDGEKSEYSECWQYYAFVCREEVCRCVQHHGVLWQFGIFLFEGFEHFLVEGICRRYDMEEALSCLLAVEIFYCHVGKHLSLWSIFRCVSSYRPVAHSGCR